MYVVLVRGSGSTVEAVRFDDALHEQGRESVDDLPRYVAGLEPQSPRWVWDSTARWYPALLAARVRVQRCHDLRLSHAILRLSQLTSGSAIATAAPSAWDASWRDAPVTETVSDTLFDLDGLGEPAQEEEIDPVAEFLLHRAAVDGATDPARIERLLRIESVGALIAAELTFAGLPWSAARHDELLTAALGPRPRDGERPARLAELLGQVRAALGAPDLNPDSPPDLLRALGNAGIAVTSTRSWELRRIEHPAIAPLLAYKKLARLASANGWSWLDTWVRDGRFRPDYVPGGVVTGRWATSGGGALQLPKEIRAAVVADPGWTFVVADAAQLEPRILAALADDRGMIEAGAGGDLYAGIVASGAVDTREHAKVAMLGAMYGATTGRSGQLMPRLARAYPQAIALVEEAARAGERGESVSTRLGRSSPPGRAPGWEETRTEAELNRERSRARAWGRFTRNFVVQGTAAEWALCWMAATRRRLAALAPGWLTDEPHLVFFLHDEIVVHAPEPLAEAVAAEVREAATEAGRLVFGPTAPPFPVTVAIVRDYGSAK